MDDGHGQEEYIRQLLEAYRNTPGTTGTVRRADRMLAAQLLPTRPFREGDRKCTGAGRDAPPDAAGRCPATGHDSFAGLFPASDRGSAGVCASARITSNISGTSSHASGHAVDAPASPDARLRRG